MQMKISSIYIYPVKSLAGIQVESAIVQAAGLEHDRRCMIVDEKGMFRTQRDLPALATLAPSITGGSLELRAPGGSSFKVALNDPSRAKEMTEVEVWGDRCDAVDLGDEIAGWLSDQLGENLRIVSMGSGSNRMYNPQYGSGPVSFADGYPLLAAGESSLEDLNSRLELPIPVGRFRPNIIVSGSKPFEEDRWGDVRVGGVAFRGTKPCARCVVTTIDQSTGQKTGKEPLRTLATFRRAEKVLPDSFEQHGLGPNDVLFGLNLVPVGEGGVISVGDPVEVLSDAR